MFQSCLCLCPCQKTVRLMVNYHGSQKAVFRVDPAAPLRALIPTICEKCEFDPAHILLLKDGVSRHELPLNKSLSELGIKELYAHDQRLGKPQHRDSISAISCFVIVCSFSFIFRRISAFEVNSSLYESSNQSQ